MYGQSCQSVRALIFRSNITISHFNYLILPLFSPQRYEKEGCWKRRGGGGEGRRLALLFVLVGKEMDITKNGL